MSERIFVFGSNLAGVHGAGSAKAAAQKHGAKRGVGVGPTGNAYAIPTKATWRSKALTLMEIQTYVWDFIVYARQHPSLTFDVVRIGCGLAGYEDAQIAPLFKGAPDNVNLPFGWRELPASLVPDPTGAPHE
jgi:hypothetical protein